MTSTCAPTVRAAIAAASADDDNLDDAWLARHGRPLTSIRDEI